MQRAVMSGRLNLLKLFASFLIIWSALMVIENFFTLFYVADIVKQSPLSVNVNGIEIQYTQIPASMAFGLVLGPFAWLMFWLGVLVFSIILYRFGFSIPMKKTEKSKKAKRKTKR